MEHFAVSAVGRDRPGIVAALTGALLDIGGNIEDSRMAILGGSFSVMLVVSVPEAGQEAELERRLRAAGEEVGLEAVTVSPAAEAGAGAGPTHTVSVYGSDHPGIVHAATSRLAAAGANITDLQTRLIESADAPIYVLLLEIQLDPHSVGAVTEALDRVRDEAGVDVSINPIEAEAL